MILMEVTHFRCKLNFRSRILGNSNMFLKFLFPTSSLLTMVVLAHFGTSFLYRTGSFCGLGFVWRTWKSIIPVHDYFFLYITIMTTQFFLLNTYYLSICFHYFYISKHHYFWPLLTIVISARSERTYIYHQWFLIIYHQLNFYSCCDPHLWYHPQYLWPPSYHLKHIYDPYEKNTNIIPSYAGSRPPKAPRFRRHGAGHRALPAPRLAGAQRQAPQPAAAHHLGGTNATQVGPGVE